MSTDQPRTSAQRLVALLIHLQIAGKSSTVHAAAALNVDRRTIRRDFERLAAVVPIKSIGEGRDKEWILDPFAHGMPLGILDRLGLVYCMEGARFLRGTLLDALADRVESPARGGPPALVGNLDRKIRFKHEPRRRYEQHEGTLETVLEGLLREFCLSFDYATREGPHRFVAFAPLTLVAYRRALYLLGREADERRVRRLAVDRMSDCRVEAAFDYPADWSPDPELDPWFGIYAGERPERVVLDFAPEAVRFVRARHWHTSETIADLPDGGVRVTMNTGGRELIRFVLEWGPQCRAVEPAWLVDGVRHELSAALSQYGDAEPRTTARAAARAQHSSDPRRQVGPN